MKILEIASFFPPMGGAFVLDQARALQAAGHEVQILYCNQVGLSHGLRQWLFPNQPHCLRTIPKWTHLNQRRWVAEILRQYREYVRTYGTPDVIHAQCSIWAGVAAYAISCGFGVSKFRSFGVSEFQVSPDSESPHSRIPYILTEHIPVELFERDFGPDWSKHPWAGPLMRDVYRHAKCVIHVAPEQFEWLSPFFGRDYRHTVISNIIDTDFFNRNSTSSVSSASHSSASLSSDKLSSAESNRTFNSSLLTFNLLHSSSETNRTFNSSLLTFPFRIACLSISDVHRKGLDVLAAAMPELSDCELILAGRGTDSPKIKALFSTTNRVRHVGELDRQGVRDLLLHTDVLVLPSRSEVQPLVLLEAMCMGVPVVTTDAVTQSVRFSDACFVAHVGDAHSLATQLRLALAHGPLSQQKTEEVRSSVSPSAIASKLLTEVLN